MNAKIKQALADGEAAAIKLLKAYDKAYDAGKPKVTDADYDKFRDRAQKKWPKSAYFKSVGAPLPVKAKKSKLPIVAGSLTKVRPADVDEFCDYVEKHAGEQQAWYTTPKLDGASGILHYRDGKLVTAWRRGDDTGMAYVVTDAARHVQGVLPAIKKNELFDVKGDVYVRGEFVMHRSIFQKFYAQSDDPSIKVYKTCRNLVVGILNRIDVEKSKEDLKRMTFVSYYVYKDLAKKGPRRPHSRHRELLYLSLLGMTTVVNPTRYAPGHFKIKKAIKNGNKCLRRVLPVHSMDGNVGDHIVCFERPTPDLLVERLRVLKNAVDIDLDGLVLEPLDTSYWHKKDLHEEQRPQFARAIKLDVYDQESAVGVLKGIDWQVTKRGLIRGPGVLKTALNFNGVEVTNATVNNARFARDWYLTPGRKIKMIRSGDVIPRIVGVYVGGKWHKVDVKSAPPKFKAEAVDANKALPTKCPACATKLVWTEKGTDLFCKNAACPGRHGRSVASFFAALGVDNVASGTVAHLIKAGYDTIPKIMAVEPRRLARLEGYGEKKAKLVGDSIKSALTDKPLHLVMHASGIFANETFSLGSTRLAAIVDHLHSGKKGASLDGASVQAIKTKLASLKGLGPNGLDLFVEKLPEWRKFYAGIREYHSVSQGPKTLDGVVVAFTGFRDPAAEQYIMKKGGRVGGVSKNCSVLFAAALGSTKCNKAQSMGIPIVAQAQAWDWLKKRGGDKS